MNDGSVQLDNRRGWPWAVLAGCIGVALVLLMSRGVISHVPLYDELLHYLSAQGLLKTGAPVIAHGEYVRARLFTNLVADSLSWFGTSLEAARIPSMVGAALLSLVLTMWVTRRIGVLVGLAVAAVLVLLPSTIELAVFARFYTLHAVLIAVMVVAVYEATNPGCGKAWRVSLIVFSLLVFMPAWHLQDTTLIAVGGMVAGALAIWVFDHWDLVLPVIRRYPLRIAVGLLLVLAIGLVAIDKLGLLKRLGETPLWASWAANRPQYYIIEFARSMPLLWPLLPLAILLSARVQPRLTLFCCVFAFSTLLVHSLAGPKSTRYVYYALPILSVVWAIALVESFIRIGDVLAGSFKNTRMPLLMSGGLLAVMLALSAEGQRAAKLLLGKANPVEALGYAGEEEWTPTLQVLRPLAASADRIMTSNAMKAIHYLGRYDYEINASIVPETESGAEFGRDERTGGQAIGTAESVRQVLIMPGTTLVVLEQRKMGVEIGVPAAAMQVIEALCHPVVVPDVGVHVWSCAAPDTKRE